LGGDAGVEQTIGVMRQLIDEAMADPSFVNQAVSIVGSAPAHDEVAELQAIYNFVDRNIRFVKDPVTKEKLIPPQELLKVGAGDCDDIAMLTAALLMAVGYPARLVTVAAAQCGSDFSHVYTEGELPPGSGNWIPLDSARPDSQFGLAPQTYTRKRAWSLADSSYSDLSGTRRSRLGEYRGGLGDFCCINLNPAICTIAKEIPVFIAAGQGAGYVQTQTPGGIQTSYIPQSSLTSGYALNTSTSSLLPLLLLGLVVFLVVR
jgi:hypothetical protein